MLVRCGICLWFVDAKNRPQPNSTQVTRTSWFTLLRQPGQAPVEVLSWSPSGRLLAAAGSTGSSITIWDVASELFVPLWTFDSGIVHLAWSPDGQMLFSASRSAVRLWNCAEWSSSRYARLTSECQVRAINVEKQSPTLIYRTDHGLVPRWAIYVGGGQERERASLL